MKIEFFNRLEWTKQERMKWNSLKSWCREVEAICKKFLKSIRRYYLFTGAIDIVVKNLAWIQEVMFLKHYVDFKISWRNMLLYLTCNAIKPCTCVDLMEPIKLWTTSTLFKVTNQEIEQSIKNEMSGDLEDALLALGKNLVVFSKLSCCLSRVSGLPSHSCWTDL